jgi:tetratricopeptide (TPR) repeat protein
MPEAGGPTTWSGIHFQGQVVVYHLARMLYDRALDSTDSVISVRVEAPSFVNDVLLTKESGARVFQSVKEAIKRSTMGDSAWCKMWKAIASQVLSGDFDVDRDIIQIVFPEKVALGSSIFELTSRASTSANAGELSRRLSQPLLGLFTELQQILEISDEEMLKILRSTGVRFHGDPEAFTEQIMGLLAVVYPANPQNRLNALDALVHLVLEGGEQRGDFDSNKVDRWLNSRGVSPADLRGRSFTVIQRIEGETTRLDAQRFFRGFPASWSAVRDNVPVSRTCYEKHCKHSLLNEALNLDASGKLRAYLIVGPKGVGKTTLAKQIAIDLSRKGHLVCWLDEYPGRLNSRLIPEFRRLLTPGKRVHIFGQIGVPGLRLRFLSASDHLLNDLADFVKAFRHNGRITLYLTVDSNHYELLKEGLEDVLLDPPEIITIPLNLDDPEIDLLVERLRRWGALGRLEGRPDSEVRQVFRRKSNKILLASLIEATSSKDENDNFNKILLREYESLPDSVQLAYPLVGLGHSYSVQTPASLFFSGFRNLPGGGIITLEQLRTSLSGVVLRQGDWIRTRHPLIARTLCSSLGMNTTNSIEDTLWIPLFKALLKSIDEQDDSHRSFIQELANARVVTILSTTLEELAAELASKAAFRNLSDSSKGILLNSIARTFQSRGDIGRAADWANKSIKDVWQSASNGAAIILMYCYVGMRNNQGALQLAAQIAETANSPWHLLHAIRILARWGGAPKEALRALESHEEELRAFPAFGQVRGEVLRANIEHQDFPRDGNPWQHAAWVRNRLELGQIEAEEAIDRLSEILDYEPNIHRAITDLCHLLFLEARYDDVASLCEKVLSTADLSPELASDQNLEYSVNPTVTKSMALGTKAWAVFRRDGADASGEVEVLFRRSFELKRDNVWAHNWRGLFLHATEKESGLAEGEIRTALALHNRVPPFYRNLARVILETNVNPYSRGRNQEIIKLCESGLRLCPPDSYWNWGGLRVEFETILYTAKSLDAQNVPSNTSLLSGPFTGMEYADLD